MKFFKVLWNGITNNLDEPKDLRKFEQLIIDLKCSIISISICLCIVYCVINSPLNEEKYTEDSIKYNSIINTIIDSIKHDWKR